MATWIVEDLTWPDYLDIINDPLAYLSMGTGVTTWLPWDANANYDKITVTATLRYVGSGGPDVPPLKFFNNANQHLQFCLGFDHFKIPDSLIGTVDETVWNDVIKTGRYGKGRCARLDAYDTMLEFTPTYFSVAVLGPGYFISGDYVGPWAGNRLTYGGTDYPNGYDVIIPFTQRAHIYQPAGQTWVLDTLYSYNGAQYQYLLMQDGVLWGINVVSHLLAPLEANGDVVLATIPDTVGEWYDLELRQEPDTPLVPVGSPVINPSSPSVDITFQVKVNGVVYYSDDGFSAEPGNAGQHQLGYVSGKGGTFIDNYYAAYMTQEGLPYLAQPTWIVDSMEPTATDCIGAWTGVDFETNTTFRGDYTNTIKMHTDDYLIQNVNNLVYNVDTVTDGLYTQFNFEPSFTVGGGLAPGVPVATYAVLRGQFFNPYGFPWCLQNKISCEALRELTFPNLGVDNAPRYFQNDLFSLTNNGRVINQRFPIPASSGRVTIGVDVKNYTTV